MANDLSLEVIEQQLDALGPRFDQVLSPYKGLPTPRLLRTVMVSLERNPKLLECGSQSLLNAAMTAACLGLEVDGVTGQGFLIPFRAKGTPRAQFVTGYKGFNTQAGRSGYSINSGVVREGDHFDFQLGSGGYIHHKPVLGNEGPIKGVWALASAQGRADIVGQPLSLREIMAVMAKSPGAKMDDSPWKNPDIGFPAMAEKTAKRRLARSMPLNLLVVTAALDEAYEERGLPAYIRPGDGPQGHSLIIDGAVQPVGERVASEPVLEKPIYQLNLADGRVLDYKTGDEYLAIVRQGLARVQIDQGITDFLSRNQEIIDALKHTDRRTYDETMKAINGRRQELRT